MAFSDFLSALFVFLSPLFPPDANRISMATKTVRLSKKSAPSTDNSGALNLLRAMGFSAVQVSPGVVALTSSPKAR